MKTAIVHDFLTQMGGAEKVVEVLHEMYPEAPIYTSTYDAGAMPDSYRAWDIRTSFLQRMPGGARSRRIALPLYPLAFESFDLNAYDLVVSSSSAFAKGVITSPSTTHVCYTYAPMRFAWTTGKYVENEKISRPLRALLAPATHYLRMWDCVASARVDTFVAVSAAVAKRIEKYYRRPAQVVSPPVDIDRFAVTVEGEDYYVMATRFAPYKRIDLAVEAFTRLGRRLKIAGTGRQMDDLRASAGPTVEFLGYVSDADLPCLVAGARGYIMPGEEDFGIAPVEANAAGIPVIAYGAGGALDSQVDGVTGVLFAQQTCASLCEAIERSESISYSATLIRKNAARFGIPAFKEAMAGVINGALSSRP